MNPRKPRKNEPRKNLTKILHPFYTITVYDEKGNLVEDFEPPDCEDPDEFHRPDDWDVYIDEHEGIRCNYMWYDLEVVAPIVQKVWEENKDKYDEIGLTCSVNEDGYRNCPRIVGKRQETDEEYNARVQKLHDDYNAYVKERDAKKKTKKKKRIEDLEAEIARLKEE